MGEQGNAVDMCCFYAIRNHPRGDCSHHMLSVSSVINVNTLLFPAGVVLRQVRFFTIDVRYRFRVVDGFLEIVSHPSVVQAKPRWNIL